MAQQAATPAPIPSRPPTRIFDRLVNAISYGYLLRVPLLVGTAVFLLPFVALRWMKTLLQNLFILNVEGTLWTTAIVLALSWSILLTLRLVLLNGKDRFDLPQALTVNTLKPRKSLLIWLVAAPLVIAQFTEKDFQLDRQGIEWRLAAVAGGALIAYLLAFFGLLLTMWLNPPGLHPAEETFPMPRFIRNYLKKWISNHCVQTAVLLPIGRRLRKLPEALTAGYLDPHTGLPWAGHWLAFTFALATGALYVGLNVYHRTWQGEVSPVPALAYALLLLLNVNWILAFFAFLLDRYRLPLLIPIALLCVLGAHAPSSDHYYSSQSAVTLERDTPYDVLHARQDKPIILVATAGGGIQAGAWTTEVLTGLEKESRAWKAQKDSSHLFSESLSLVSSVSGGAMGSMYFLNLYSPDHRATFREGDLDRVRTQVTESSLDDIAWAMVYKDFPRIFFPYFNRSEEAKLLDRGYMLEETWRNRGIRSNLANWRAGVKEGVRPVAIFNSTVTETGEPMLLATTDFTPDSKVPRRQSFYDLYPQTDIPVVTAVRMAATFPYVTPAARKLSGQPEYHMIDGGYYDNPGVLSVVRWLDEGLQQLLKKNEALPSHVLIIQIRSFPESADDIKAVNRGWFFQAYAPIDGLLNVRTTAQLLRDREALTMLAQRWATSPTSNQGSLGDRIRFATFTFNGSGAPLSWAMNEKQKSGIRERWRELVQANGKDLRWVHCSLDSAAAACQTSEQNGPY